MADLKTRVDDLTGFGSTDDTALGDWFDDGVKDVMNSIPSYMLPMFSSEVTFTSNKTLGENAKLLAVVRSDGSRDQMCREIPFTMSGRAADNSDVNYATNADPVYYIHNGVLTVLPTAGECKLQEVSFSDVTITGTSIDNMPNDAEHLVVLYASIRALQRLMNDKSGNADITTALSAINTENDKISAIMDSANTAIDKVNAIVTEADTEFDLAKTEIAEADAQVDASVDTALGAITTAAGRINTAVELANAEFDKAVTATTGPLDLANAEFDKIDALLDLGEEDTESAVNTALGAMTTELNKVDDIISTASGKVDDYYTSIGDIDDATELWDDTNKRFKVVRDALSNAQNLIDDDGIGTDQDAIDFLKDADSAISAIADHLADEEAILGDDPSNGNIADAITAMKAAIEEAESVYDNFEGTDASVFGDEDTFLTASSQLTRVKAALDDAEDIINVDEPSATTDAYGAQTNEDIELVTSALNIAQTEIQRAQMHLSEWTSIGDMRVKQIQASLSEASAYGNEIQARLSYAQAYVNASNARASEGASRLSQVSATTAVANQELSRANVAIAEINTLIASYRIELEGVTPYLNSASSYIAQAQGYSNEVSSRLAQAQAKREEANSRIASGNAFLGEANTRVQVGASYLSEAKSALDEAQAYATEVNSRMAQIDGYNKNVSSRMQLGASYLTKAGMHLQEAQGYGGEASGRLANAQSYANEVASRLNVDTTEYQWLQAQQANLQKEYERGIQELRTPK